MKKVGQKTQRPRTVMTLSLLPLPSAFFAIATAKAVRTIDAGHAPSHRVDPQTARVACESDF
jgi:hypothetical protein